jgi:hypothetical protein
LEEPGATVPRRDVQSSQVLKGWPSRPWISPPVQPDQTKVQESFALPQRIPSHFFLGPASRPITNNHQQQLRFVRRADPGLCFVDGVHDSPPVFISSIFTRSARSAYWTEARDSRLSCLMQGELWYPAHPPIRQTASGEFSPDEVLGTSLGRPPLSAGRAKMDPRLPRIVIILGRREPRLPVLPSKTARSETILAREGPMG